MRLTSLMGKYIQYNKKHLQFWNSIFIVLLSTSFVLTDWMFDIFTFSECILSIALFFLFISGNFKITKKQIGWIASILIIVSLNILANYYSNNEFVLKVGIAALIKISFYSIILVSFYNYFKDNNLFNRFLKMNNIIAIIICIIGIYITIAIYSNGSLPYEFFWKFTRTDRMSYAFNQNLDFIRTRSIFSEPSYLGYYLNIILGMNYFNKQDIKIKLSYNLVLTLTIVLTFSYSAIGVMLLTQLMYLLDEGKIKQFKWNNFMYLYIGIIGLLMFLSWDLINETIIERTIAILNGEDLSATGRLLDSWKYVNIDHLFRGNGIGHTADIWNIYAYILSDLGIVAFVLFCLFSLYTAKVNFKMGLLFVALNFQKGGYLSSGFWIYLLLLFIYMKQSSKINSKW
ncbi:hypothetical protein [Desemzia sp. FAM 24101]|uniref:hypothetical protein n=1 Tax=unclassified Desemzia TaxID=2685243 RepID=UPI003884BB61